MQHTTIEYRIVDIGRVLVPAGLVFGPVVRGSSVATGGSPQRLARHTPPAPRPSKISNNNGRRID